MRTSKSKPKESTTPNQRTLTIQSRWRQNSKKAKTYPELTLAGIWLENFGFEQNSKVIVVARKGKLIIMNA